MKRLKTVAVLATILIGCFIVNACKGAEITHPFPHHGSYAEGIIRPNHISQQQMDDAVTRFYEQWKARYIMDVPGKEGSQKYIYYNYEGYSFPDHAAACSEAQGYGLLISVFMAGHDAQARAQFDALYAFCKAYPSNFSPDLMAWQQLKNPDGSIYINQTDADSATDGDMDIAYALILADKQWGSKGAVNYREEAKKRMRAVQDNCINDKGDGRYLIKLGDWVQEGSGRYVDSFRCSDIMPDHFILFQAFERSLAPADKTAEQRVQKWEDIHTSQYKHFLAGQLSGQSKDTGLLPDFMSLDPKTGQYIPSPNLLEGANDGNYFYNSCRTPWRLSMGRILYGDRSYDGNLLALNRWMMKQTSGDPQRIVAGYTPDGKPISNYFDLSFTAPLMVSAMVDAENQAWLNAIWDVLSAHKIQDGAYYGNTLKLLAMIIASDNWWIP